MGIDRIDRKILRCLAADGRRSWRELANDIGLSLTPTMRRVKRLEDDGYIMGYHAQLNEALISGAVSAYVFVTLESQAKERLVVFEREIAQAPQVMSCFQMTGDFDYILRVVVSDLNSYQQFLTETLTSIPGVSHIESSFSLKTVLHRLVPLL